METVVFVQDMINYHSRDGRMGNNHGLQFPRLLFKDALSFVFLC